jgi:hypothetical protein
MVGLPSMASRELIMRRLLSKEKVEEGLDFKELATMTEGYSGSDLKVSIMGHEYMSSINQNSKGKPPSINLHYSVTELVHHGSISPCEGADPERKKEGSGKQMSTTLPYSLLCFFNHYASFLLNIVRRR